MLTMLMIYIELHDDYNMAQENPWVRSNPYFTSGCRPRGNAVWRARMGSRGSYYNLNVVLYFPHVKIVKIKWHSLTLRNYVCSAIWRAI